MAALMAFVCAVMLVVLSLPYFNQADGQTDHYSLG